jgi:hypothetical protein
MYITCICAYIYIIYIYIYIFAHMYIYNIYRKNHFVALLEVLDTLATH